MLFSPDRSDCTDFLVVLAVSSSCRLARGPDVIEDGSLAFEEDSEERLGGVDNEVDDTDGVDKPDCLCNDEGLGDTLPGWGMPFSRGLGILDGIGLALWL